MGNKCKKLFASIFMGLVLLISGSLFINNTFASTVTVLPGNGGTLPMMNHLLLHQNDNSLKNIQLQRDSRLSLTDLDGSKQVVIKNVKSSDKVIATYGNVGAYNNQPITAKMIISDIKLHDTKYKLPSGITSKDASFNLGPGFSSGISDMTNVIQLKVTFQFFYASGNKLNLQNSFLTVSSLDGPLPGVTSGYEYTSYENTGKIYIVQNSIVKQITNPTDSGELVMAGQMNRNDNWPYFSSSGATFGVSGSDINFIYGTTRATQAGMWYAPLFSLSTVTLGKPEINEPKITSDTSADDAFKGETVTYDLTQPVNTLDEDLLNKYSNWNETLKLPKETEYKEAYLENDQGTKLPNSAYQVTYDKTNNTVTWKLTKSGINSFAFKGEKYHFKAKIKPNKNITDQTKLSINGTTTIDGQTKNVSNNEVLVNNKRDILVHHYMTDSKDKVAEDQTIKLGYGLPYELKPLNYKPVSYTYNDEKDVDTKGTVSDDTKEAIFYYDADPFLIHVHYLLEDGQLLDNLNIQGLYGDTYNTQASDYDDLYTIVKDKLPQNKSGKVTEKPINVNYYYRPTTGKWVDVANNSSILARKDYEGNIRSINQTYANNTGYSVKFDQEAKQVAITVGNKKDQDHVFKYGTSYTYQLKNEKIKFDIDNKGQVTVQRNIGNDTTNTIFNKSGIITNTTKVKNNDNTLTQQTNTVDGKNSLVTKESYKQTTPDGYVITANRNINPKAVGNKLPDDAFTNIESDDQLPAAPTWDSSNPNNPIDNIVSPEAPDTDKKEDSFNDGEPVVQPKFKDDTDISPNNNQDDMQTPVEISPSTDIRVEKNNKPVYQGKLTPNDEKPVYTAADNNTQISAGTDDKGFYVDKYNGDNETPRSYTLGDGYNWNNDNKPDSNKNRLPQTGSKESILVSIFGLFMLVLALVMIFRQKGEN